MNAEERAWLLRKCSDALPSLAGSLAARIAILNQRDAKARTAGATLDQVAKDLAQGMRAEQAETSPRTWHNRLKEVEQKEAKETEGAK